MCYDVGLHYLWIRSKNFWCRFYYLFQLQEVPDLWAPTFINKILWSHIINMGLMAVWCLQTGTMNKCVVYTNVLLFGGWLLSMLGSCCILTAATSIPMFHTILCVSWNSAAISSFILWTHVITTKCESGDSSGDGTWTYQLKKRVQEPNPFVNWWLPRFKICGTVMFSINVKRKIKVRDMTVCWIHLGEMWSFLKWMELYVTVFIFMHRTEHPAACYTSHKTLLHFCIIRPLLQGKKKNPLYRDRMCLWPSISD